MKKQIVMIVGSLRKQSFNLQLAQKAAELMAEKAQVSFLEYADLPFMNQDIEFPTPEPVTRVRNIILSADGIWIMTPEYNSSYPGVLKNLLDWLSRPLVNGDLSKGTALSGKKVTVSGAGGRSAAAGARQKLGELLTAMRMKPFLETETGISLNGEAYRSNVLTLSEEESETLRTQAEAFLSFLEE